LVKVYKNEMITMSQKFKVLEYMYKNKNKYFTSREIVINSTDDYGIRPCEGCPVQYLPNECRYYRALHNAKIRT